MKCPSCGYENKETASACNLCGQVLQRGSQPVSFPYAPPPPLGGSGPPPSRDASRYPARGGAGDASSIFPNPVMLDPRMADQELERRSRAFEEAETRRAASEERHARRWLLAAGACLVLAVIFFAISRIPISESRVDEMYADYVATAPNAAFPRAVTEAFEHPSRSRSYLFQVAHAYEVNFRQAAPFENLEREMASRRQVVEAGGADPGQESPDIAESTEGGEGGAKGGRQSGGGVNERIAAVESVTTQLTPAGHKPFETLRDLAGKGSEAQAEMRDLSMELVSGHKESQLRAIDIEYNTRRMRLEKIEAKAREELGFMAEHGSPKMRSIARRLNERLFPETSPTPSGKE